MRFSLAPGVLLAALLSSAPSPTSASLRADANRHGAIAATNGPSTDGTKTNGTKTSGTKAGKIVAGYFPAYNADQFPLDTVNLSLYTNLNFFVATTQQNFSLGFGTLNLTHWDSLATEFVNKTKAAGVTPSLSIGGWDGSMYFSDLVSTSKNRTAFATTIAEYVDYYGFEGVDIDWEYPSFQGIGCNTVSANDTDNLTLFMEELRTLLPTQQFTAAVSIDGIRTGADGAIATNLTRLAKVMDYLNVMAYDTYGGWSSTTGPNGPLYATCADAADKISIETAMKVYTSAGFSPAQLIVGIPGYGHSFTLLNSTLVPKVVGKYTSYFYQEKNSTVPEGGSTDDKPGIDVCGNRQAWGGIWLVSELVKKGWLSEDESKGRGGFKRYFDDCSGTPFLFNKKTLKFIAYDDTQSTKLKAEYAKAHGAAGVFFFDTTGPRDATIAAAKAAL
jgi:chitinase